MEAGLQRFGTDGWASTTVKGVCTTAELTERYFYESFENLEALFSAVFDATVDDVASAVAAAIATAPLDAEARARAGVEAFLRLLAEDPRKARVQLIEHRGIGRRMNQRAQRVLRRFGSLVTSAAKEVAPEAVDRSGLDLDLVASAVVGALRQLATDWYLDPRAVPIERLVDHAAFVVVAVVRRLTSEHDRTRGRPEGRFTKAEATQRARRRDVP